MYEDLSPRDFDLAVGERDGVELGLRVEARDDADALRRVHARADGVLHAAVLLPLSRAASAYDLRGRDEVGREAEEGNHQVLQQRVEAFLHVTGVSQTHHLPARELPLSRDQEQAKHLLVDHAVGEGEAELRVSLVESSLGVGMVGGVLGGEVLDGVDEHLRGDLLLVRLPEVEAAVVQRQVVVLLLDLAAALRSSGLPIATSFISTFSPIHSFSFASSRSRIRGMQSRGFRNSSFTTSWSMPLCAYTRRIAASWMADSASSRSR